MTRPVRLPLTLRRTTVLLAAMAACFAASTSSASAMLFGIQDDPAFLYLRSYDPAHDRLQDPAVDYRRARELGARVVRFNFIYSEVSSFGWQPYDAAVTAARRAHMRIHATVMGDPEYTNRHHPAKLSWKHPSAGRFYTFVRAIARRYRHRIYSYGIWNEPNLGTYLAPQRRAPLLYARLYQAAYKAIRRSDSRAKILIGETTSKRPGPIAFLRAVAKHVRGGLRADGLADHPFQFFRAPDRPDRRYVGIANTPLIQAGLRDLARRHLLRTPRGGALPIYYTEFGYQRHGVYRTSEGVRADWAARAIAVARHYHVRMLLWYQLKIMPRRAIADRRTWDSGLLLLSGRALPVYRSIQRALRHPRRLSARTARSLNRAAAARR